MLRDGLIFYDDDKTEMVIFNHYSFCELLKWTIVKYASKTYEEAHALVRNSALAKEPDSYLEVSLITHELDFHWAMLIVHGEMYWLRGIPSDTNTFNDEYEEWRNHILTKYSLKEIYTYSDFKQQT